MRSNIVLISERRSHRNIIVFYLCILNPDFDGDCGIASEICFHFLPVYGAVHFCFFKGNSDLKIRSPPGGAASIVASIVLV